jgi:hypothetical protein
MRRQIVPEANAKYNIVLMVKEKLKLFDLLVRCLSIPKERVCCKLHS